MPILKKTRLGVTNMTTEAGLAGLQLVLTEIGIYALKGALARTLSVTAL
jgi:hypothetical protein